jgi:hypothetical protein
MPEHIYNRGYAHGERDARNHEPAKAIDTRTWYAIGYRDGYTDARKREEAGR